MFDLFAVVSGLCDDNTIRPSWLLYLCIAFGLMFLIMLIINVFLCSAMTCACARTEVIEKEPSIIEDYDPYRSWHGSQYGSRYRSTRCRRVVWKLWMFVHQVLKCWLHFFA